MHICGGQYCLIFIDGPFSVLIYNKTLCKDFLNIPKNVSAKQITTSQLQNKYHCKYKLDTINLLLFVMTIFRNLPLIYWFGTTNFCE